MPLVALAGVHPPHDQEEAAAEAAEEQGVHRSLRPALLQGQGEDGRAARPGANGRARSRVWAEMAKTTVAWASARRRSHCSGRQTSIP